MATWTLIAHPDPDLRVEIEHTTLEALKSQAGQVVHAGNHQEACAALFANGENDCGLIITGVALPSDAVTPLDEFGAALGIELVRAAAGRMSNQGKSPIPAVLISAHFDLSQYQELWKTGQVSHERAPQVVQLSSNWSMDLMKALENVRLDASSPQRERALNIDLRLLKQWSWQVDGDGVEDYGDMSRDDKILNKVKELSDQMSREYSSGSWERLLGMVRGELFDLFFGNQSISSGLVQNIIRFGADHARVRFIVDETTHELLLEALQNPENQDPSFWMLSAPIYRRFDRPGRAYPLFKDRTSRHGKINCLIVAADPAECSLGDPWNTSLEALPKLSGEVDAITKILKKEGAEYGDVGEPVVFQADKHASNAVEDLEKVLEQGPWHLVHFVGHAVRSNQGSALVLGGEQGAVVKADSIARKLAQARTQFLYLSSCKSADAYFVMKLVERHLPAVFGFRWPVKDDMALACAKQFYRALFEQTSSRKYLEYALLSTKCRLHDDYEEDSIWAAPVLVMQVDRAQDDWHAPGGSIGGAQSMPRPAAH